MKKLYILIFLVATMFSAAMAQDENQSIVWRMNVKMHSASEGELIVKAVVQPGWHLYGMKLPEGGPKATLLDFSKSIGVEFTSGLTYSPELVVSDDAMFGMKLSWWDKPVTFRRKFRLINNDGTINCSVTFMCCNNKTCLPPTTKTLTKKIGK